MVGDELRPLGDEDLPALQALIERAGDYYESVHGHPPGPAEAQSVYMVLPEGKVSYDDKLLLGVVGEDGQLAGVADLIRDWPEPGTWTLGLLLLAPDARGRGVGARVLAELERRAVSEGARRMRLGVERVNERARAFWERYGYRPLDGDVPDRDPARLFRELGG